MIKIATFDIEVSEEGGDDQNPSLEERGPILRSDIKRLDADTLRLREAPSQELEERSPSNP